VRARQIRASALHVPAAGLPDWAGVSIANLVIQLLIECRMSNRAAFAESDLR